MPRTNRRRPAPAQPPEPPRAPLPPDEDVPVAPAPGDRAAAAHRQVADTFRLHCRKVKVGFRRLPQKRSVDGATLSKMAGAVGGDEDAFQGLIRLFPRDNPAIVELGKRVASVKSLIEHWCLPHHEPGWRVIPVAQIPAFEARLRTEREYVRAAAVAAQDALPAVIAWAREKQKDAFKPAHYAIDIAERVRVEEPRYMTLDAAAGLPPEIQRREINRIRGELDAGVTQVVGSLAQGLTEHFDMVARQLGNRTRLYPPANHPDFATLHEAEVLQVRGALLDPTLAGDQVRVTVRYRRPGAGGRPETVETTLGPIAEAEYRRVYRPAVTEERRPVHETTIDGLFERLRAVTRVRETLGDYGAQLDDALERVRETLARAGTSTAEVTANLRRDGDLRRSLSTCLELATAPVQATATEAENVRRRLRARPAGGAP